MIRTILRDYGWAHLALGLTGNLAFFAGSILFLPRFEDIKTIGVWLFIVGSFLMLVGSAGGLLKQIWEKEHGEQA
ncbi:YrhK family protein [Lutibaculum baratangense]|uniref:YrhK domain-containing protein n=1 Tax=Lutibaculum baratangense AMV1 TaxID=631454 RepID=V4REI8_9HYPH|nr:YrhK family protein [Lutibaculum baratangense]ESR24551.1 hypothetical protein N177_2385 [Lutibaculum baratangense AMV1]